MGMHRTREYLLSLPRVEETFQFDNFVYWVLDKSVGGKMFAMLEPEPGGPHVMGFAVPGERFYDLLEVEGISPAPYLARAHWIVMERWDVFSGQELEEHLRAAYERVQSKLPRGTARLLDMKDREYRALVRERRAAAKGKTRT